ncbi:hypothetical protein FB559_0524 [Actinoallomurus bryophytorum]|uniref:Uncharacterized protein n=1 Tax=Actinoallomurus bryophytorum TaxID=1490222 RepID=A0A543CD66_9ACTN|nr:hypothetical protein FB559_0524 [Actinoallomurus bryophytorum]
MPPTSPRSWTRPAVPTAGTVIAVTCVGWILGVRWGVLVLGGVGLRRPGLVLWG